ncbi:unnamed protein product [Boreogadus saida]
MKALIGLLLLVFGHGVSSVLHSLHYFYTASSGLSTFPEFVAVGMVDGVQFDYYDSNTQREVLKQDWMEQVTRDDPDYLERNTGVSQGSQQVFKADIVNLKKRFNQTGESSTSGGETPEELMSRWTRGGYSQPRRDFQSKVGGTSRPSHRGTGEWFVSVQERIVLPEASTERVWSWELQVDGGQEPFSPTGTDGRGDGGGRLEVLAVRSVAVVWRRTEAEVLEAEASLEAAVAWRAWRWRANLEGLETAEVLEATAGLEAEANLEVLEAEGLEEAAAVAILEANYLEANYLEVLEAVGLEGLEAAAAGILEADYLEDLEAGCGDRPGGGFHMAAVGLEAAWRRPGLYHLVRPHGAGGQTSTSLKTPSSLMTDWFLILRTSSRSRGRTKGLQRSRLETLCGTGSIKLTSPSGDLKGDQTCGSWVSRCRDPTLH